MLIILSLCACKKAKNEEPKIVEDNIVNAVDFSKLGDIEKDIKVYVDGELDRSKNTFVNASVMHKVFNFSGSGKVNVRFKINNEVFKTYEIDFEKQTVNLLE